MKLSQQVKSQFGSGDRSRGEIYFKNQRVHDLELDSNNVISAFVEGSYGGYEVNIGLGVSKDAFQIECECHRFDDGYPCKHIWATLLALDELAERTGVDLSALGLGVGGNSKSKSKSTKKPAAWQHVLQPLMFAPSRSERAGGAPPSALKAATEVVSEIIWLIDVGRNSVNHGDSLQLSVFRRSQKKNGQWGKLKSFAIGHANLAELADPCDRMIASRLLGAEREQASYDYRYSDVQTTFDEFELDSLIDPNLLAQLQQTGRFYWCLSPELGLDEFRPIDATGFEQPWTIRMEFNPVSKPKGACELLTFFGRGESERVKNEDVVFVADNGVALFKDQLVQFDNAMAGEFWRRVQQNDGCVIKKSERKEFLKQLAAISCLPEFEIPEDWVSQTPIADAALSLKPTGLLELQDRVIGYSYRDEPKTYLQGSISFRYGNQLFTLQDFSQHGFDEDSGQWLQRDADAEQSLLGDLANFPISETAHDRSAEHDFEIHRKNLFRLVDELGEAGWEVKLHGKRIKQAGAVTMSVESGQDWFDLSAAVDFEGESVPLPSLLAAIKEKSPWITLADGSQGRLPSHLIEQYSRIAQFGSVEDDKVRFRPTQAMLLDALLDSQQDVTVDRGFQKLRNKLKSFTGIKPKSPPKTFKGELRAYQEDGLGWLHFLREFGFGGCLADDMGLGKTIQVLSLLESRRTRKADRVEKVASDKTKKVTRSKAKKSGAEVALLDAMSAKPSENAAALLSAVDQSTRKPSIVVVPKSLVFNWIEEASKFTPKLRFLNYTGTARKQNVRDSEGFDVLITTYGTLRKDIADLAMVDFDYAILDESQAIKNSAAQCAKSSRLLRASHRLAMTGTPIENHLGELWSLFEFLNPGMLGASSNFASLTRQAKSNEDQRQETLLALSKAMQPFILRRTKDQVLTDLPSKTEQTLYCDMLPAQKKQYNELKEYYRVKLAKDVETKGVGKSKIQVLEALLRLRQVACDPRLLDEKRKPGAKLELFQQQLNEVVSEGHKVLVFSQFTSLLALVKQQLDLDGVSYEYLDGKTSNRQAPVKRFQEDPSVSAFLISLKAGGHGLNLTAADYVFLLDPWWNPAVEAQAIDRAHRMGQQRPVIAYRMICRDTVEEKIVKLQESKRELADSIIRADESLLRTLTADDIQVLLT